MPKLVKGLIAGAGAVALAALLYSPLRSKLMDRTVREAATCDLPAKRPSLNFTLKDAAGTAVSLHQFKGKVVLLDFWATWCGPCKREIPGFVDLYSRYRSYGFEIVGLLLLDSIENVPAFARTFGMNYTLLDASDRPDVEEALGPIAGLPTSFLIARDGRVCKTHVGYAPKEQFEAEIRALLQM